MNGFQNGGNASHTLSLGRFHDGVSCSSKGGKDVMERKGKRKEEWGGVYAGFLMVRLGDRNTSGISCSSKDSEDVMERERKRKEAVCVGLLMVRPGDRNTSHTPYPPGHCPLVPRC